MNGMFKNPLVLALLGSVLINGILIGKTLSPKRGGPHAQFDRPGPMHAGKLRLETLPRYLTPEQRKAFDAAAKASGQTNIRKAVSDLRAARRKVVELARTQPYDNDAVRAAMADIRAKSAALAQSSDASIAAFLESATDQERKDILAAMTRRGPKGKGRKGMRRPRQP